MTKKQSDIFNVKSYYPSNSELEYLKNKAVKDRKMFRIQQARDLGNKFSSFYVKKAKQCKSKTIYEAAKEEHYLSLRNQIEQYENKVSEYYTLYNRFGTSHNNARATVDKENMCRAKIACNSEKKIQRYKEALQAIEDEKFRARSIVLKKINSRSQALNIEKERARHVANLPKPEKLFDKKEEIPRLIPEIKLSARYTKNLTLPPETVCVIEDPRKQSLSVVEEKARKDEELQSLNEKSKSISNSIKADIRGKSALKTLELERYYDKLLNNLDAVKQGDDSRKKRNLVNEAKVSNVSKVDMIEQKYLNAINNQENFEKTELSNTEKEPAVMIQEEPKSKAEDDYENSQSIISECATGVSSVRLPNTHNFQEYKNCDDTAAICKTFDNDSDDQSTNSCCTLLENSNYMENILDNSKFDHSFDECNMPTKSENTCEVGKDLLQMRAFQARALAKLQARKNKKMIKEQIESDQSSDTSYAHPTIIFQTMSPENNNKNDDKYDHSYALSDDYLEDAGCRRDSIDTESLITGLKSVIMSIESTGDLERRYIQGNSCNEEQCDPGLLNNNQQLHLSEAKKQFLQQYIIQNQDWINKEDYKGELNESMFNNSELNTMAILQRDIPNTPSINSSLSNEIRISPLGGNCSSSHS